jgi:predicted nucleic acid-binding protein
MRVSSGLLDTSVVVDWHNPDVLAALPDEMAISAVTVAELAAGPHLAASPVEAAKRQARLQEVESILEPLPFDAAAARSYGLVVAAVVRERRKPRSRFADLLIAAIAHANRLDLYTRNGDDFAGLEGLVSVFAI